MDIWKFYSIGHADLRILNPTSGEKLDELVELLALPQAARLLDIACGKGEFLTRAVLRWQCDAVGVDRSPLFAADARQRAGQVGEAGRPARIEIIEKDAAAYDGVEQSFDAVSCLGASWIWGGYAGTLDALSHWARPGGLVISGEPYWRQPPDPAYLEAEGFPQKLFGTHEENVRTGTEKGLGLLHALVSSEDEWDRYQGYQWRAAERYARAHPEDPDVPALLARMHGERDKYLRWGRDTLGWAIYVFLKEPWRNS